MTASQVYPSMAPLFDIFNGPVKMAVLEAAIELDLARVLEDHSDLNAIAGTLGIDIDPTGLGLFLDAAVAMGMAEKKKGQYANTDFSRHFLDSASPVFMGGLVKNMKAMQHQNLDKIIEIIKTGPPEVQRSQHLSSEAKWESAVGHLAAYQRAGMASLCADIVQDLPEFARAQKILDLGGGPGIIGAEVLRRLPGARGVLPRLSLALEVQDVSFDKGRIAECGSADRPWPNRLPPWLFSDPRRQEIPAWSSTWTSVRSGKINSGACPCMSVP